MLRSASLALMIALSLSTASTGARAQSADAILSQPLDAALTDYARRTSIDIVYDSALTAGRRSSPVLAGAGPQEGLRQLLRGTGLSVRFTTRSSAVLFAADAPDEAIPLAALSLETGMTVSATRGPARAEQLVFINALRREVEERLRADAQTARGNYSATVRLWIDGAGTIGRVEVSDASRLPDDRLRAGIMRVLGAVTLDAAPPDALPTPLSVRVRVRSFS